MLQKRRLEQYILQGINLTSLKLIETGRAKIATFPLDATAITAKEQTKIKAMMTLADKCTFVMVASDKAAEAKVMASTEIPCTSYVCKVLCEKVLKGSLSRLWTRNGISAEIGISWTISSTSSLRTCRMSLRSTPPSNIWLSTQTHRSPGWPNLQHKLFVIIDVILLFIVYDYCLTLLVISQVF